MGESKSLADLVPTNWCDSLLSGGESPLTGTGPWGCPEIEGLLRGIRERIRQAEHTCASAEEAPLTVEERQWLVYLTEAWTAKILMLDNRGFLDRARVRAAIEKGKEEGDAKP